MNKQRWFISAAIVNITVLILLVGTAALVQAATPVASPLALELKPRFSAPILPYLDPIPPRAASPKDDLFQFAADNHILGFGRNEIYLAAPDHMLKVEFVGANDVKPRTMNERVDAPKIGGNPVSAMSKITYPNLWNGITLIYEQNQEAIAKSTYHLAPHTSVDQIRLRYNVPVHLDEGGNLILEFDTGYLRESAPVAWQDIEDIDGQRIPVDVQFVLREPPSQLPYRSTLWRPLVGFIVGAYDPDHPLIIDPTLTWHTFLGGERHDKGADIVVDKAGNIYITGTSYRPWGEPINPHTGGWDDVFVVKMNNNGVLLWSTFLGGGFDDEVGGIVLDNAGNIYLTGTSPRSWGEPINPHDTGGDDAFVAKINNSGVLQWNTFLGGAFDDEGRGIALDGAGNIYITGASYSTWGEPINPHSSTEGINGYNYDAFVAKLDNSGEVQWNTFMGKAYQCSGLFCGCHSGYCTESSDRGTSIIVDSEGDIYVVGESDSSWGEPINGGNIYVAKLNGNGALRWNTFMPGQISSCNWPCTSHSQALAMDESKNIYVVGTSLCCHYDTFVTKLNNNGILQWTSSFGGTSSAYGEGIAVDNLGNIYAVGTSNGTWGEPLNPHSKSATDAFMMKINANGVLQWNTFMGGYLFDKGQGIAVDETGGIYMLGSSYSSWDEPLNPHSESGTDVFVVKIAPPRIIDFTPEANSHIAAITQSVAITLDTAINTASAHASSLAVHTMETGLIQDTYNVTGDTAQLIPPQSFKPGELIQVSATRNILSIYNEQTFPSIVWQFRAAVSDGDGRFKLHQSMGGSNSLDVALGDVDHDGDLDAFVANAGVLGPTAGQANRLWRNTGAGNFSDSGQLMSGRASTGVALGDVDGNGDLDAFVSNYGQRNVVWINSDGQGTFINDGDPGHDLSGNDFSRDVTLGDVDGDGDLDALVANSNGEHNKVWLNDGTGHFSFDNDSGHKLGTFNTYGIVLGDIDNDGDLDAIAVNEAQPNWTYLNDSTGHFSSGQMLVSEDSASRDLALGDVDDDGDLDVVVANGLGLGQANGVWLNQGGLQGGNIGTFILEQTLGNANSLAVALGDVDADGDLDAVFGNLAANKIWLNKNGIFTEDNQNLDNTFSYSLALGDVDNSNSLAILATNGNNETNSVWLNGNTVPGEPSAYLPIVIKPGSNPQPAVAELYIKTTNTGNTGIEIFDLSDTLLLSCTVGNNTTHLCGTFDAIGSYKIKAQTTICGLLGPKIFHDATGGSVTRSIWCN